MYFPTGGCAPSADPRVTAIGVSRELLWQTPGAAKRQLAVIAIHTPDPLVRESGLPRHVSKSPTSGAVPGE